MNDEDEDDDETTMLDGMHDLLERIDRLVYRARYHGEHLESLSVFESLRSEVDDLIENENMRSF